MGVAPEAIVEKIFFEYRLKCCSSYFREKLYSPFLKVIAPKAIIETPS
jgi:hypothetical protein